MIQAFTAVAHADPAEKAELLSASISVAMNTTAFGADCGHPVAAGALLSAVTKTAQTGRQPGEGGGQVAQSDGS
ncbi:MAG: hypothetical protein MZV65_53390 [Chromatiales bacterium]|nr:hypothetical protein [Chromatiales bacterium]